jgi:hypothetical protein
MRKGILLVVLAGWCVAGTSRADAPDAKSREGWKQLAQFGSGFVVWESNRTGRWRLWRRDLDGSGLRQISPEEAGRDHFCPHISPDGRRLVYLSYAVGSDPYQEKEPQDGVPLYLMRADGTLNKQLTGSARSYAQDRAAVWLDNDNFVYIDGQGSTRRWDTRSGQSTKVIDKEQTPPGYGHGLLINAAKTHATSGQPSFASYDAARSRIIQQKFLDGCEPYFSHDGKWGFWMGGAGGPINRIDLQSRRVSPILTLNDPRMPKDRCYLYFPMVSCDGRMFAFAASPNQHDHFTADYDIFVARMDPRSFEVLGQPVRYSFHPGCDRFPDVYLAITRTEEHAGPAPAPPAPPSSEHVAWPSNRQGLVYVFQTGDASNQVPAASGRPERGCSIRPRGRARLDHDFAMVLAGGSYLADQADDDLLAACRRSNQLTVEALIHPDRHDQSGPARIVTFSSTAYSRNFTLGQDRDKLIFRLRTPGSGDNGVNPETTVCPIPDGQPVHVVITYQPAQLLGYLDGKEVYRGSRVQGDFSNWAPHHLLFGDEFNGERNWAGTLEGVAIYSRALETGEIQRNAARYRELLRSRKSVPKVEVAAKLLAKSPIPTLKEIKPYRDALIVCKYRVIRVLRGNLQDPEVLVAQWALLDAHPQPVGSLRTGEDVRIVLEPWQDNPQVHRFVCKDSFDGERELLLPRYYDVTP